MMNEEINKLKLEIEELKIKNNELEQKLRCYTNPERNKKYYEKNSNIIKEKAPETIIYAGRWTSEIDNDKLKEKLPDILNLLSSSSKKVIQCLSYDVFLLLHIP